MRNLENIVFVITGASSGIGRATALEAARCGASVVLAARRKEALEQLAEECTSIGGKGLAVPTDVSKEDEVNNLYRQARNEFGKIDVWVNNASVTIMGPFEETPIKDIKRLLDINLMGYIYGAHVVIPHFREQGKGILVNVSSMVGVTSQPYSTAYNISKFGIRGLSISLEQELSDVKGVHICTVLPAVIDTPIFNQAANYMGRAVKPPEPILPAQRVADTILSLASNPKKEVIVGGMARMNKMARAVAPGIFDKKFKGMIEKEHFQEQAIEPSSGNLYEPMPQWAKVSGGWRQENPTGTEPPVKKIAIAGAVLLGITIGVSFLSNGKSS